MINIMSCDWLIECIGYPWVNVCDNNEFKILDFTYKNIIASIKLYLSIIKKFILKNHSLNDKKSLFPPLT